MDQTDSSKHPMRRATRDVYSPSPTAFEAAQLIKPPASRGVSDWWTIFMRLAWRACDNR